MLSATKMMRVSGAVRAFDTRACLSTRGFAFSVTKRLGLKESSTQTNIDYDLHKKDSLAKQKRGSGHWKPELASDSEEAVKADRASRDHSSEQMAALQERTKRAAEETSKAGTSMRDGM
ncbi:hypothetical protein V8C42DRAFT_313822 [Trichoderma barbatum]